MLDKLTIKKKIFHICWLKIRVMRSMKVWEENLKKLKQFKRKHKHTNVPINLGADRILAQWVENIRTTNNKLPNELLSELKKLNFNFQYKKEKSWDRMYVLLVSFWKAYGHTYVPHDEQYNELALWTENQREAKSRLPVNQIAFLDKIDFDWETITRKRSQWYFIYQELRKFKQKYGHTKVVHTDKEHYKLSTWVHNIRPGLIS